MESKLCRNCFADLGAQNGRGVCPVCGWDNDKPQLSAGLRYGAVLSERYVVGRAKSRNSEGITYSALDQVTKKIVDIREFFPIELASRASGDTIVTANKEYETEFDHYLDDFLKLSRGVSRLREVSVVASLMDIFEENYTAYAVYESVPSITLRRFVEKQGGRLSWNQVNQLFMPVLTALGLMNSLGVSHLGISPDTIRIRRDNTPFITGFSIKPSRRTGSALTPELASGCAAIEQYQERSSCGEISDVYGLAAVMLFALTGRLPEDAPRRMNDQRLMISKEVLHNLPPYVVTAIANALQVERKNRTVSFERFKTELSAAPNVVTEIDSTEAIRRLPSLEQDIPQNRGLPPAVWLVGSCVITFVALLIVASVWLNNRGMSLTDITKLFETSSTVAETIEVPNMVNESYEEWNSRITNGEYDFVLKVSSSQFSNTVESGNIISQSPFSGEKMTPGGTVVVTVSKGSATRILPEIKGMSYTELAAALEADGFVPVMVEEISNDIEAGHAIRYQDHSEGESLDYGAEITVVVSSGPEAASSPSSSGEE